ncbi:hypothetical protein P5V15_006351 [Pogonomyrmex californicus]
MEQLLLKLLVPDNATIQEATAELKKALQNPDSVPALCQLIMTSTNPQIRQYAALVLRRRYSKGKNWTKLSVPIRTEFKKIILQALERESVTFVRNSIAQLIGVIVKHELPTNSWPEIIHYVQQLIVNEGMENKELGLYTLAIMTDITPDAYASHARSLVMLLAQTLSSLQNLGNPAAFYILSTLRHLIPIAKHDDTAVNTYTRMMPLIMNTIQALTEASHDTLANQSFELLDELCENMIVVITPHVKPLVHMCLTIIAKKSIDDLLKVRVVTFIGWLARIKKKALVKHKLVEPIVDMLFVVMMIRPDEDDDSSTENENSILTSATQTLDLLAMHLPPEKLIPHLLRHIEPGLQSTDVYVKKTSYVAIAVLAEGCAEYIRSNYLEFFLRCICQGITDSSSIVRNAALYALGQYSEHLQPEISQYSSELLPVLFEYLGQVCSYIKQEKKEPHAVGRMFYALEMFCENLHGRILPYLPKLMERLFDILNADTSPHVKELTLSAIGAAACASKEHLLPYFETIINILNNYLTTEPNEENMCLKVQAIDTLGVIARSIGNEHFAPLAATSLDLGIKLLRNTDDPDLRKSLYGLFAAISTIMKKDMAATLPEIVEYMIMSIRSADGILMHYKDDEANALTVYDDLSDTENEQEEEEEDIEYTDNEEENDEDIEGYSVENAYMEEKEESVLALKEIAEYTEEAFMPYLERSFEEIFKLINYPQEDIRKASIEALLQFCINLSKINTDEGKKALLKALSMFVPKLSELIRLDEEPTVAICGLEAYEELLMEVKSDVLIGIGHREAIVNCVMDVMKGKTACQDQEEVEDVDTEAEQDELLIECAGTVFSSLGKTLSPEDFALHFLTMLPFFIKRLKMDHSEAQRSFAVGTIAECFPGLKHMSAAFVSQLLPTFLQTGTQDPCNEVRSNCFFGIGELAFYAKEAVYPHYPQILQTLSCAIAKETDAAARDNVVGAIARLIITNYSNLPLEQVFPVFVEQLPLKADFQEHKAVFKSILTLYQAGVTLLQSYIHTLLKVAVVILHEEKTADDETRNLVMEFIKSAQRDFVNDWNALFTELPPEVVANIQRIFS